MLSGDQNFLLKNPFVLSVMLRSALREAAIKAYILLRGLPLIMSRDHTSPLPWNGPCYGIMSLCYVRFLRSTHIQTWQSNFWGINVEYYTLCYMSKLIDKPFQERNLPNNLLLNLFSPLKRWREIWQ